MSEKTINAAEVREQIIEILKTCYDPEIPVDIYELGLIYTVEVQENGDTRVEMTLTSPACPVAESLPIEVEQKVRTVPGTAEVKIDLVWEPMWTKDMLTEAAKLKLGFF
jgi:FeS assembly SUF system protein